MKDIFSMCFGEEKGIMAIGDIDESLYVWIDYNDDDDDDHNSLML